MNNETKPMHTLAKCGLIVQIFCASLNIAALIFAEPFLKLLRQNVSSEKLSAAVMNPLGYVMPMLGVAVYVLLFLLLRSQIEHPSASAGTVLILILASIPVMSVLSIFFNLFATRMIVTMYDAETMAALSYVRSAAGFLTVIGGIAYPLLAAAAGMNWQRWRQLSSAS